MNKTITMIVILIMSVIYSQQLCAELRDPTRPPSNMPSGAVSPTTFQLSAIVIESNRRIAVINGISLQIGDTILGEHVISIEQNTVQLEGANGKITLFLFGDPIKSSSNSVIREKSLCRDAGRSRRYC